MEIYRGPVTHSRLHPVRHAFVYEIFMVLIDLETLEVRSKNSLWPLVGFEASAIASFRAAHHMRNRPRTPGQTLASVVRDYVFECTGARPTGPIHLLTSLSYFGYVFNPVSFYYIYAGGGGGPATASSAASPRGPLESVIAEVSNTPWGEEHCYMMHPAVPGVIASRWDSADGGGWKRMLHNTKGVTLSVPRAAPEASATAGEVKGPSAAAVAAAKPVVIETASLAANLASAGAVAPADFASLAHAFAEEDGESSRKKADPSPAGGNSDGRSAAGGERQNLLLTPQAAGAAAPPPPSLFSARSKFSFDKTFHVSPFMALNHRYEWIFTPPGETLLVQSQNTSLGEGGERMLNTQLRLTRVDGGSDSWATWLYLLLVAFPFLTMRIQWWIHWEAFRVWWKGVSFYSHPTGGPSNWCTCCVESLARPILAVANCCSRKPAISAAENTGPTKDAKPKGM